MKISNLSNTALRFLSAGIMLAILLCVILTEYFLPELQAVRWLGILIVLGAIWETFKCFKSASTETLTKNAFPFSFFVMLLVLMLISVYFVGVRPWVMLWLLMVIVGADVGGWLFGHIFGGDKMWERLSAHKTWAGQIGGIICGILMSVIFFFCFKRYDINLLFSVLFGCTIALLSQYGDLTASFIKRKLGIKDFGNLLPGHGGIMDRFDGWIYVLPFMWFFIR